MQYTAALLALLPLANSLPTQSRLQAARSISAGGPTRAPLPAHCPLPQAHPAGSNSSSFAPTAAFAAAHTLYSYLLSPGATSPDGTGGPAAQDGYVTACLETCYGYGNPGDCVAVWTANDVTAVEYGVTVEGAFACYLYSRKICAGDLEAVAGADFNARAVDIGCAARQQ